MLDDINLMAGLSQKMSFLQTRQRVLSENISNADTPDYRAKDIKEPDFAATLGNVGKKASQPLGMATTSAGHMNFNGAGGGMKSVNSRHTYQVTPEGNSVAVEEQMMKASKTAIDYQLMTNLYNKNIDLLRAASK